MTEPVSQESINTEQPAIKIENRVSKNAQFCKETANALLADHGQETAARYLTMVENITAIIAQLDVTGPDRAAFIDNFASAISRLTDGITMGNSGETHKIQMAVAHPAKPFGGTLESPTTLEGQIAKAIKDYTGGLLGHKDSNLYSDRNL